jgi:hypothetical protein
MAAMSSLSSVGLDGEQWCLAVDKQWRYPRIACNDAGMGWSDGALRCAWLPLCTRQGEAAMVMVLQKSECMRESVK